ncbi:uncharacterized protein LOC143292527 isoform X2 [Babylonia areolata]|uniref:uncharacterized protein LOC143292527 isoform X2 n=1 Tax=Babylonia areolata TaxID=304850 RepID=UPI003FD4076C
MMTSSSSSPFRTLPSRTPFRLPTLMMLLVAVMFLVSTTKALRFLGQENTYALFPKWYACPNASISFEFKTRKPSALLLYTDDNGRYDYLQLALTKGAVRLWINLEAENQFVDIKATTDPLNDGQWHRVEIRRNRMETILYVDGTQTSKVALGSDDFSGRTISESNYVFFGGVPLGYGNRSRDHALPDTFFPEKFRGEVRNILYFNCSCIPERASMVEGQGVSQDRPEACEIRNPCPADCPCVSVDDGSGCECNYKRECLKDLLASYYLPMDEVVDGTLVNPSGLDSLVEGGAQLTRGVRDQALMLDGRTQWLRVAGADHRRECFGDLARCEKGYYMGLWMQFHDVGYQRGVYLSNGGHSANSHGVALLYSKGRLDVIFKMADGREWRTRSHDVLEDRWYHVAATWSVDKGLFLYIDGERRGHDRAAAQKQAANNLSRYNGFYIGRSNDNTGTDRLGQVLVDDFVFMSTFKDEKEVRESGAIFHYHLPMELASQRRLVSLHGFKEGEVRVQGAASQVQGQIGEAVLLSGDREFLDLGDVTDSCLGDLDLCRYGVYVSLWMVFNRLDEGWKALISSPVLGLHQDGNVLVASANNLRQSWEVRYPGLDIGVWYFVELSWSPNDGLSLFVDLQRVGYQPTPGYRPPEPPTSMNMYVGRESARRGVGSYPAVTVDELEIFYGDRATLMDIGYIQRDRPSNYHFDMDTLRRGRLLHNEDPAMVVATQGRPRAVSGKVGNAIELDGRQDALDFGNQSSACFGNLDLCPHGMMVSLWLQPKRLGRAGTSYFLSSGHNGLSLSYRDKKLHVTAATTSKTWQISASDLNPNQWQFLEVSFHPDRGLSLYLSGRLVAHTSQTQTRPDPVPVISDMDRFYVGRGNVDMSASQNKFGAGAFDELSMWYADRDFLTAHGYIQRDRPDHILVQFEEAPDQNSIAHPSLDIRLEGRPRLVPGKVGNALELRGRGQYADLGQLSHTCYGNLARCSQGVTVSAWMKFRSYENNMVFLSTGENGLLLLYRDGYIYASAYGRGLVTAPRFDTDRWYYVELSWHPDHGLKLFVDNDLVAESQPFALPQGASTARNSGHFYLGRPNDGDVPGVRYTTGNFDIDELEVWNGRREDLLAFGHIQRDEQGHEVFSMESAQADRLSHPRFIVLLVNGASLGPGRVGQALQLNGQGQYLDLGSHLDSCLGNLDRCLHGLTLSVWLHPNDLQDNVHFLSAPFYSLFYEDGELKAEFYSAGKEWTVGTPRFRSGEWQRVTLTWHQKKGLSMYLDDELVDVSRGVDRPQRDQPASDHVYVGRGLQDARLTADMQADELQVWYDHLDQLRTTGRYQAEVRPQRINFDNFQDGYVTVRDRHIHVIGEIRLIPGLSQNTQALYLDGRTQFLDFGDNFTCNGNLDNCRQGITYRFALRPDKLEDGTYFMDSFPVKLYYKDGRLHAEMQTSTRVWNVDTSDFREGQWSRVELAWHPTQGLTMYINGRRVAYETYPRVRNPYYNDDWRTYVGRPLSEDSGTYANTIVDGLQFYNAYRTYVPDDRYLALIQNVRPTYVVPTVVWPPRTQAPVLPPGVIIGETGIVTTQRPPVEPATRPQRRRSTTTIIRLDGSSFVRFNFDRLPKEYLLPAQEEEFSFYFLTDQPEGLIWFHDEPRRDMYIAMKDGHLVFVNDDGSGRPEQVSIGERYGVRFDDYRWHRLKIRRSGRRIRITVDDNYQQEYIFSEDVQFLTPAEVWLGGTPNTADRTGGNIRTNFNGGVAEVIYVTTNRVGSNIYRNEVNLIARLSQGSSTGNIATVTIPWHTPTYVPIPTRVTQTFPTLPPTTQRPIQPRTSSVTIVQRGVYMPISDFDLRSGSTITFNFKTINQNGLLLFAGEAGGQYMALELVDGRLYFVKNFGREDTRTALSQRIVADGQPHEVSIRFYDRHVDLRVDDVRERVDLSRRETLPTNMGTVYVGGYRYQQLPWRVWSRESYLGCLSDLRMNGRMVDFEEYVKRMFGRVVRRCQAMPQNCARSQPCANGLCRDSMTDFLCDCSRTGFRGERCSLDAWTALFNGSIWGHLNFSRTLRSHADNMHLRFRTPLRDGLLFETFAKGSNVFLRCSLENGRVKVETNLGGELKTMYAGENLNDLQWHTLYIQRRGNEMEVWVDDDPHVKEMLAGSGYQMAVDRIYLGGTAGSDERYIGYLQNFFVGDVDILEQMRNTALGVDTYVSLPPLVYYPVTFPDFNSYVTLSPLRVPLAMVLHFMFKTTEPNGIILFSSGRNREYLVVELFEGKLYIQFYTGADRPLRATAEQIVNDGKWHTVTIRRSSGDQRQFLVTVDGVTSSVSYAGAGLDLQGPLYIGGAPEDLLQEDYIKNGVLSRTGFRGCLASMDLSGQVPDLSKFAQQQGITIYDSCTPIIPSACTEDSCRNFGTCIESGSGTFTCNCDMTAHGGSVCENEPIGFLFQNFSRPGLLIYDLRQQPTSSGDEIAFGVMTRQENALLLRVFSELINDYIEFRLRDGYVVVEYDTDGMGGKQTIAQLQRKVNDGEIYHIIRFIRTPTESTLFVDDLAGVSNAHASAHGDFDRMSKIYIGGGYVTGTQEIHDGFAGIIGGLHINGLMVFPKATVWEDTEYIGDVVVAPRPFSLRPDDGQITHVIPSPSPKVPIEPTVIPPIFIPSEVPPGVGGGGAGWVPGVGGVDGMVYPGGDSGTAVLVPGGGGVVGSGTGLAAASVMAVPPPLPAAGPRAGAVMGTVLGLMALASSLMWAFYRCKPGWCTCLRPPAASPMSISSPRAGVASASNKGAVIAAGGGVGGAGGAISGAGAGGAAGSAGGAGGAGGGSFSNFYMSQTSSGSAGGGGAGGQGGEAYDTATLRATGTFSNKGTSIGTPKPVRAHLGSTASAGSAGGGYSSTFQETSHVRSASGSAVDGGGGGMGSYHYEAGGVGGGSSTADYDMATGMSNYQSNTLTAGGGTMGGAGGGYPSSTLQTGTMGGAGGFSTMQSSYNYSVKTVRTVSGQQQMQGYAGSQVVGVPPGALGEEVRVDCCLMTNDGHSVVTGSSLGPPQVWDMQSGELLRIMQGETVGSTNLHLACNDRLLVGAINADLEANQSSIPKGVHNYMLQIWDFTTGRALEMSDVEVCSALTLMSDNDKVVFARSDKFGGGTNVVVWDLLGNQPIKHMRYDAPVGNNDYVHFLALSQNDRYIIAGFTNSFDNFAEFVVFDMALTSYTVSDPSILRLDANPECTAVLPRDEAVTGLRNGDLVIWSMRTGQPSRQLLSGTGQHAHAREVKAVARSEDGKYLVSASTDGTLKLWDMETERHIDTLSGHTDEVWCCAISPDSEIIVSGSRDKTIRLWRLKNGSEICNFNAGVDIFHVTMSRDKSTIVALGDKTGARKLIMLQVVRTKVRRQVSS